MLSVEPAPGSRTNGSAAVMLASIVHLLWFGWLTRDRPVPNCRLAGILWTACPDFRTILDGPARWHRCVRSRRGRRQLLGGGAASQNLKIRRERSCAAAGRAPGHSPPQPHDAAALDDRSGRG